MQTKAKIVSDRGETKPHLTWWSDDNTEWQLTSSGASVFSRCCVKRGWTRSSVRPTAVLLLTGYWPVMGNSIAIFAADGEVHLLVPEDELEIAAKTGSAMLTDFSPASLHAMRTPGEAIRKPLISLSV